MKHILTICLLLVVTHAWAAQPVQEKYLTAEDAAIAEAKQWQKSGEAKPILSDDGLILFPFGQYMPTLTCATYRACTIQLQAGEKIVDKGRIGDTRFTVDDMVIGTPDKQTVVVAVRPLVEGLDTNLFIPTDRRLYEIRLKSSAKPAGAYVNRIGFFYPEDMVVGWSNLDIKKQQAEQKHAELVQADLGSHVSLDQLDWNYTIGGDASASFRPTRVLNNGEKTFIYMPPDNRHMSMPTLVILDEKGNPIAVNFRIKPYGCKDPACNEWVGNMFIVDYLVKRAVLVMGGVNDKQIKVEITASSAKKSGWLW